MATEQDFASKAYANLHAAYGDNVGISEQDFKNKFRSDADFPNKVYANLHAAYGDEVGIDSATFISKSKDYVKSTIPKGGDLPLTKDVGNAFGVPEFQKPETIMADGSQTKPISEAPKQSGFALDMEFAKENEQLFKQRKTVPQSEINAKVRRELSGAPKGSDFYNSDPNISQAALDQYANNLINKEGYTEQQTNTALSSNKDLEKGLLGGKIKTTAEQKSDAIKKTYTDIPYVPSAANTLTKAFINSFSGIPKIFPIISGKLSGNMEGAMQTPLYQLGENITKYANDLFPENPELQDSFIGKTVPEIAGQLAAFAAGGAAAKGVGKFATASTTALAGETGTKAATLVANQLADHLPAAVMAGSNTGAQMYDQALQLGQAANQMDKDQFVQQFSQTYGSPDAAAQNYDNLKGKDPYNVAFDAYKWGMASGSAFLVAPTSVLAKFNTITEGTLAKAGVDILKSGVDNALQFGGMTVFQNKGAEESYDITQKLLHGVVDEGGAGFLMGSVISALGHGLHAKSLLFPKGSADRAIIEKAITEVDAKKKEVEKVGDDGYYSNMYSDPKIKELSNKKVQLYKDLNATDSEAAKSIITEQIINLTSEIDNARQRATHEAVDKGIDEAYIDYNQKKVDELKAVLDNPNISDASKLAIQKQLDTYEAAKPKSGTPEEPIRQQTVVSDNVDVPENEVAGNPTKDKAKTVFDKYENENYSVKEIVDEIKQLNIPELKKAINEHKDAQMEYKESGGRYDMDDADSDFMYRLEKYLNKEVQQEAFSEKPTTEAEFNKKYIAQHKDIRGKKEGKIEENKKSILENGFNAGTNVNTLPIYTGTGVRDNLTGYGNKKGDVVYLITKEGQTQGGNGGKTKEGYKPKAHEVVTIEYDGQSTYDAYKNQLESKTSKSGTQNESTNSESDITTGDNPILEVPKEQEVQPIGEEVKVDNEKPIEGEVKNKGVPENEVAGSVGGDLKIDDKDTFYHASNTKRNGRLRPSTAQQFGTGIYFTTSKDLASHEFGEHVTEAKLALDNPVYTNTKEWNNVEKLALEKANEGKPKDEEGDIIGEEYDIAEIKAKFISDAAKELGYDAIIDKNSSQYENEILVLDETKIKYTEDTDKADKSKSGTQKPLSDEKQPNKVAEKTLEEQNANNKGISKPETLKGNKGEVIEDKESKNDKAGEGDGGVKKSDVGVPENQKSDTPPLDVSTLKKNDEFYSKGEKYKFVTKEEDGRITVRTPQGSLRTTDVENFKDATKEKGVPENQVSATETPSEKPQEAQKQTEKANSEIKTTPSETPISENRKSNSGTPEPAKEKTKLDLAKERRAASKAKLEAIKENRKENDNGFGAAKLTDEEIIHARHEYHLDTVEVIKEWLKEKKGSINDYLKDTGGKLTIALKTAWDEANGGKKIEKPEDLPYTNEDQPIIGITRAHIDTEQIERGLDKNDKLFKSQKNPELWNEIKQKMVSEPDLAIQRMDEISQEIAEGKSPKFSKEDAVIGLHERVRLKVERSQILSEQKSAIDSGNQLLAVDAALKLEQNAIANERNNLFIETATSTYGGGLQSSQMLSTESFDYTSIKNRIEAEQGKPLSVEQEKQFKDISEKYQQFQDKLAENEAKFTEKEKEYQKRLDDYHEELQKARTEQAQSSNKKESKKRPVNLAREAEKERLRKILGIKSRSNTNALFDPSTIINKDFIKYHKMVFEDAIGDFRHFAKEMIKDFGNGIKEHLPKLFKDSGGTEEQINAAKKSDIEINGEFDILTKKAILDADGEFHEGLKGVLDKMFNNRVEAGETDYKKNVNAIYDALEPHIKDLDKNDLGDLIGGYGKFKELTKDPAKLLAAEGRRNLVLDAKLREVNKGVLPKRNGQQRALKTKAERDKETAIAKGIREQNLTPEPNEQEQAATYASELESYHRSLERQIEDYDAEGKSGVKKERTVGIKKSEKFTDKETKALQAERDRVKAIRDAVLKERAATELEKTVKRAKQLTDDINKAKKEGRTKDAETLQKEKDLTDGEIGNLVNAVLGERTDGEKKIDGLRKQIDDVLNGNAKEKTTKAELTDAEKQQVKALQEELQKAKIYAGLIKKPLTAEEKQLESLQNKLDDLYAGKVKEIADKKVDSAAVKELKDKIEAQKELMGLKAAKAEPGSGTINAIKKGIDDINAEIESLNSGTFNKEQSPNSRGGVTNFKTVKEKNTPQLSEEAKQKIKTLQGERDALQEQKNNLLPQIIKDKALIAKDIKQKQRRLIALKALVEAGKKDKSVYKPKVKEPFHPSDPRNLETRKMIADKDAIVVEIKKLENQVAYEKDKIAKANAGLIEKGINELSKIQRFQIFANPWGMGRLAYAAMMRPLLRVPTEIAKLALSNLPYTRGVMRKAPAMYRPSVGSVGRANKSYYSNYFAKKTFKDALTEYNKRSNYSLLNDETYRADRWDSKYDFIMAAPEMSHGFMKAFPKIAAHESSYEMALENLSKTINENTMEYYDITDPRIQHLAMQQAHMEAYADVFMSDAEMPQLTRNFLEGMITSENLLMQAAGMYGKQMLPVVKVPANFYHEVIQQIPGIGALDAAQTIYRSGKRGDAKDLRRGVDNLTPEQAHKAARALVNQTVGLMVIAAGMALYKEYGDEAIKKLEEYEHYVHSSAIPLLHMGLRMGKDKAEEKSMLGEGAHTMAEETTKLPQVKAVRDVARLSYAGAAAAAGKQNWDNASKQAKQMLATLLIPSGAAELAKRMDDERKRDPKTFKEILEMRIPGMRDLAPARNYTSSNPVTQKFLEDKGIEITRFGTEKDPETGEQGTEFKGTFIPLNEAQVKNIDALMEKYITEEIESRIDKSSPIKNIEVTNGEFTEKEVLGGFKLKGLGKENLKTQISEIKARAKERALVNLGYVKFENVKTELTKEVVKEKAQIQELINNK